jgi:hypothetical protein
MEAQSERESLIRIVDFGDEVDQFIKSRVGQYMLQMASIHVEEAVDKLKYIEPTEVIEIRKLQNKIWVAENVQQWLLEAVHSGLQAMARLEESENES